MYNRCDMKRYDITVLAILYGTTYYFSLYSYACTPPTIREVTLLARQYFDPACYIMTFEINPPDSQGTSTYSITNSSNASIQGTSTTTT